MIAALNRVDIPQADVPYNEQIRGVSSGAGLNEPQWSDPGDSHHRYGKPKTIAPNVSGANAACSAWSDDLLGTDGYIFAAPENLAAIAGIMKDFYDRCYYPVLGRLEGRPYAQMMCAGSDGENAARQTTRIATGWRLKEVQVPLIVCTHAQTPEAILAEKTIPESDLARCRDLGAAMAAGLSLGVF